MKLITPVSLPLALTQRMPLFVAIELVECRAISINAVQIPDEKLNAVMQRLLKELPVQSAVVIPRGGLRELSAHEQELLAGMGEHECQVCAQGGEALSLVSRYLVN